MIYADKVVRDVSYNCGLWKKCAREFLWRTFIHEIRKAGITHSNKRQATKRSGDDLPIQDVKIWIFILSILWMTLTESSWTSDGKHESSQEIMFALLCCSGRNLYYVGRFLDRINIREAFLSLLPSYQVEYLTSDHSTFFCKARLFKMTISNGCWNHFTTCVILKSFTNMAA